MSYRNWKQLKCVFSFHNSSLKNQIIKLWKQSYGFHHFWVMSYRNRVMSYENWWFNHLINSLFNVVFHKFKKKKKNKKKHSPPCVKQLKKIQNQNLLSFSLQNQSNFFSFFLLPFLSSERQKPQPHEPLKKSPSQHMLLPPIPPIALSLSLSLSLSFSCSFFGKARIWLVNLGWLFLNSNLNNHLSLHVTWRFSLKMVFGNYVYFYYLNFKTINYLYCLWINQIFPFCFSILFTKKEAKLFRSMNHIVYFKKPKKKILKISYFSAFLLLDLSGSCVHSYSNSNT